jgi:hypothetical protein
MPAPGVRFSCCHFGLWLCGDHFLACDSPFEIYFEQLSGAVAFVDPFPPMAAKASSEEIAYLRVTQ